MAKLVVHFSNKIMTGSLYSQNEKSYENHGSKLLSIFSKTDPETLGVEVVMVNEGRVSCVNAINGVGRSGLHHRMV